MDSSLTTRIAQENDARACQQSLWLAMLHAERLRWSELVDPLLVLYERVQLRRDSGGKPGGAAK